MKSTADMEQEKKYLRDNMFVISCAARTGSTMLVHMLRTHPGIICHGEVYTGDKVGTLTANYPLKRQNPELESELLRCYRELPEIFFYKYVYDLQGRSVVGFKFKTSELFDPKYSHVAKILIEDIDIKVVHLHRSDLVAQYISHQVVLNQTGITFVTKPEDRTPIEQFNVDLKHFRDYVNNVFHKEQSSLDCYSKHRGYYISYEDIVSESEPAINSLQEFIGVQPSKLKKGTEKIIDRELADLVTNLAVVRELYAELEDCRPIKNCFS